MEDILKNVPQVSTILVGECHGVVENMIFLNELITNIRLSSKIGFVGFEYPIFAFDEIHNAVKLNQYELIKDLPVIKMLLNDGRFSKEHFGLLVTLYKSGIPFVFFDSGTGTGDDRDSNMYTNILEATKDTQGKTIIIAGNVHTSLKNLVIDGKKYKPLGTYFNSKETLLIKLKYHSGSYTNFGVKQFLFTKMPSTTVEEVNDNEFYYNISQATATNQ